MESDGRESVGLALTAMGCHMCFQNEPAAFPACCGDFTVDGCGVSFKIHRIDMFPSSFIIVPLLLLNLDL
jgi:hypothetical protein